MHRDCNRVDEDNEQRDVVVDHRSDHRPRDCLEIAVLSNGADALVMFEILVDFVDPERVDADDGEADEDADEEELGAEKRAERVDEAMVEEDDEVVREDEDDDPASGVHGHGEDELPQAAADIGRIG